MPSSWRPIPPPFEKLRDKVIAIMLWSKFLLVLYANASCKAVLNYVGARRQVSRDEIS
jgi:hypothetical protein